MAEGLIQKPTRQKQMEDLGCEYFRELLSRSFFQPSSNSGKVSLFVMHDLINDLAYFVARRISFRLEEKHGNSERDGNIAKARHSSYIRGELDGMKKFEAFQKAKNLRSFLPFGLRDRRESWPTSFLTSEVPLNLLPSLRRLRVLSLRRYKICELSSSIGDLKHVRFIDLSCALIATLPESIGTLSNLQTLILRDCKNLNKLPANTSNLSHLRHLDVTGADSIKQMPPKIGELTSLRTLSNFIVSQASGSTINELGSLIHLRGKLCISGLENVADALDSRRANLKNKQGLDVLLMKWSNASDNSRNGSVELEVLDTLKPHKMIKKLTISGYHGLTFPAWVGNSFFCNMVSLKFQNCGECISLPPLGQLPSLENLHVQGMKGVENVGPEFYGSGCSIPFPALQNLTLEDMPEWKDWSPFGIDEEAQAFPRLSEISIKRCLKLVGKLPCNLPCLRKLDIIQCPLLVVALVPSSIEVIEAGNTVLFDSLTSLSLKDVSILDSFRSLEEGNETAVLQNAMHNHLGSLTSLSIENIRGVTSLWKNEAEQQRSLPALRRLVITRCPQLISLFEEDREEEEGLQQQKRHEELPYLIMLEYFEIGDCGKLEKLPQGLHNLKSLRELTISDCPCLVSFPKTGLPSTLRRLEISWCKALRSLPELVMLNCLEKLEVLFSPSLTYLGLRNGLPPNLKELWIRDMGILELVIVEEGMKINCPSLETVQIWYCESLKYLPDVMQNKNGGSLGNLSKLEIRGCGNLESIPEGWLTATNLRELCITGCKKLNDLPHHVYTTNNRHLTSLKELEISSTELIYYILKKESFTNLTSLSLTVVDVGGNKPPSEWGLHRLSSLTDLWIRGSGYGWASFPPEEEDDGMMLCLPPSLINLTIDHFTNLEKLSCRYFQNMHSLKQLVIWACDKLTTITELGQLPSLWNLSFRRCSELASFSTEEQGLKLLPPSLLDLGIDQCPKLKQRFEKGKGQYWPLISHLPRVTIDGKNVFDPSS